MVRTVSVQMRTLIVKSSNLFLYLTEKPKLWLVLLDGIHGTVSSLCQ